MIQTNKSKSSIDISIIVVLSRQVLKGGAELQGVLSGLMEVPQPLLGVDPNTVDVLSELFGVIVDVML